VRDDLPRGVALTIAAQPSWCTADAWIDDLPIDEAVPLFFTAEGEDAPPPADLQRGAALTSSQCQGSLGLSGEAPPLHLPTGRRLFVAQDEPWTDAGVARVMNWRESVR
jgi:hypothetical protein